MSKRIISVLVVLVVAFAFSACAGQGPAASSSTPAPAATSAPAPTSPAATATKAPAPTSTVPAPTATPKPRDKVSITIDWVSPAGKHAGFYVAMEKGYYAAAGIDLEVKLGRGSLSALQVVANKTSTFGFATGDTVVTAVQASMPVKTVAAIYQGNPASVVGMKKKSNVKTPKDLEGLTISVSAGAAMYSMFPAYLKATGVDASKVKTPNNDLQMQLPLTINGDVDGMVATLENLAYLEDAGEAWSLKFSDAGIQMLGHTIAAHNDLIRDNPDLVKRFVGASIKGFDYAAKNQAEAVDITMKAAPEAKRSIFLRTLAINMEGLHTKNSEGKPTGWSAEADWKNMESYMRQYVDPKIKEMQASDYMTNQFIP